MAPYEARRRAPIIMVTGTGLRTVLAPILVSMVKSAATRNTKPERAEEQHEVEALGEGSVQAVASWSASLKCVEKVKSGWAAPASAAKVVAGLRGLLSRAKVGQVFAAWLWPLQ